MATQTRRTTRRAAQFFRTTVKASMVTACCGLILWSAVAAHAAVTWNGIPWNGIPRNGLYFNALDWNGIGPNGLLYNGMPIQGLLMNGAPLNGIGPNGTPIQGMPRNGLPSQDVLSTGAVVQTPTVPAVPQESLPWSTLSHRPLGEAAAPSMRDGRDIPPVALPEVR